jgi:cleavage and polyadenylation specificity factor subunit 1
MKSSSSKTIFRPLVSIQNLAGYTCVFLPGPDPSFVLKTSKSIPHVHRLAGNAVYVDNSGIVRVSLMPTEFNFDGNWGARKVAVGDVVQALSYFPPMGVYVVSTTQLVPFDLAEDDGSIAKDETTLQPEVESGAIKILSPLNWSVVDQ